MDAEERQRLLRMAQSIVASDDGHEGANTFEVAAELTGLLEQLPAELRDSLIELANIASEDLEVQLASEGGAIAVCEELLMTLESKDVSALLMEKVSRRLREAIENCFDAVTHERYVWQAKELLREHGKLDDE